MEPTGGQTGPPDGRERSRNQPNRFAALEVSATATGVLKVTSERFPVEARYRTDDVAVSAAVSRPSSEGASAVPPQIQDDDAVREISMELTLPSRPESVTLARQALRGIADAERWNPRFADDVKVAVSEGCASVVMHAYPDGRDGPISLRMEHSADRVAVVVSDRVVGITPSLRTRRAGLGLGLPLIAALADEVSVRTVDDGSTTHVRMTFLLESPTARERT
jgi:serine/threonine-protein kinase RsbW